MEWWSQSPWPWPPTKAKLEHTHNRFDLWSYELHFLNLVDWIQLECIGYNRIWCIQICVATYAHCIKAIIKRLSSKNLHRICHHLHRSAGKMRTLLQIRRYFHLSSNRQHHTESIWLNEVNCFVSFALKIIDQCVTNYNAPSVREVCVCVCVLTTSECAKTIGNAKALTTIPMVMNIATSFVDDVFEYASCVKRRETKDGTTESM